MSGLTLANAFRLGLLCLLFAATAGIAATYQFGTLHVDAPTQATVNFPMDGAKARVVITNAGSTTLDYLNIQVTVKETGATLIPVPSAPSLAPGASRTASCIFESGLLSLPTGVPTTRTLVWNIAGSVVEMPINVVNWGNLNGNLVAPPAGQGNSVSLRVVDESGNPISASVSARAGSYTFALPPTGAAGMYAATLHPSNNWIVSAEASGRRTGYLALSDSSRYTGQTLVLPAQNVSVSYGPARVLESGIGPWMGRDNTAGNLILLSNGMEHWNGAIRSSITEAKVRLYTIGGQKLWEYAPGYETWAVDLSADGRWALVATLDPSQSSSGIAGPDGSLALLDANTGLVQWQYALTTTYMNSPAPPPGPQPPGGRKPGVREVKFSPDATAFALGDNLGDLTLVLRADPSRAAWSANLGGDVRGIRFSTDSKTVYAVFGSGLTAAFRVADGAELWRTETYSWAHQEGFVMSPDGNRLGLMTATGDVMMLDAATGRVIWQVDTKRLAWWASFSGDGSVFLAGTQTGATIAYAADSGTPVFALGGSKGGGFPSGKRYFLHGNFALYDQTGTRLSNFITGLDGAAYGNWQVAAVSPDGLSIILGQQQSDMAAQPVVFQISGQSSTLNTGLTVEVSPGWNLLGNATTSALDVATSFSNASKVATVWKWIPTGSAPGTTYPTWAFYSPALNDGGLTYASTRGYEFLTTINAGEGFWVNANTAFTAQLPVGAAVPSTAFQNMTSGWHLIATGDLLTPSSFNAALSTTPPTAGVVPLNLTTLWAWDNATSKWYFYAPSLEAQGGASLTDYITSKSYMHFTSAGKTLGPGVGFWVNKP